MLQSNRLTDRPCYKVCSNRPHLELCTMTWPNKSTAFRPTTAGITELERTAIDWDRTDHISLTHVLDLTYDPDLQSPASYNHKLLQKFKGQQSVPKIEWKQITGQTDGGNCITFLANAVNNHLQSLKTWRRSMWPLKNMLYNPMFHAMHGDQD